MLKKMFNRRRGAGGRRMIVIGDRYVAVLGGGLPIEALPLAAFTARSR